MADLTIAVSEAVCAKTLEVVVANFGFDVADEADFGVFTVALRRPPRPEGRLPRAARRRHHPAA